MTSPDDLSGIAKRLVLGHFQDTCGYLDLIEDIEAALRAQREAGRHEVELWDIGRADDLTSALNEFIMWAQCDRHEHGPGPCEGFDRRLELTTRARELFGAQQRALEQAEADVLRLRTALQTVHEALELTAHGGYGQDGVRRCHHCLFPWDGPHDDGCGVKPAWDIGLSVIRERGKP
jgi:hypothetical protein